MTKTYPKQGKNFLKLLFRRKVTELEMRNKYE